MTFIRHPQRPGQPFRLGEETVSIRVPHAVLDECARVANQCDAPASRSVRAGAPPRKRL